MRLAFVRGRVRRASKRVRAKTRGSGERKSERRKLEDAGTDRRPPLPSVDRTTPLPSADLVVEPGRARIRLRDGNGNEIG